MISRNSKTMTTPHRIEGGLRTRGQFNKKSEPGRPLISVITVVRNGEKTLEQTILSVLDQTYDNIEYIIIDGGSTDGTIDIIKKYEDKIAYWMSEPDKGIYDAMNKGIAASTGELINLLNADDYLEPNAVELVVRKYLETQAPGIIYGRVFGVDDLHAVKAEMIPSRAYWLGMTINHQSMFVHRMIYERIGKYDLQFPLSADYDFLARAFSRNVEFIGIDAIIVNYRVSGVSASNPRIRAEARAINQRYFGFWSMKQLAFVLFNYLWMPLKLSLRTALYTLIGVESTRAVISLYKKKKFIRS